MTESVLPLVVQCCEMPTDEIRAAHVQGKIRLRVWKPGPSDHLCANRAWVLEQVPGASAILCVLNVKMDSEIMDAAGPSLRVVSTMSVGFDHIDLEAAKARHVRVGHTPSVLNDAVADLTLLLMLMITRRAMESARVGFTGPSLHGKTIGLIGFGGIAQTLVTKLQAFHPGRILYKTSAPKPFDLKNPAFSFLAADPLFSSYIQVHGSPPVPVENEPDLHTLAAESDIVVVLANLSASTHHVVDAAFLEKMKPSAYLVNVSRGGLVDTAALIHALHADQIAGAALDVVEGEPNIPADHGLLAPELADKVVLLSHIASGTIETRHAMASLCARNGLGALGLLADGSEMPAEVQT
ncbi:hypothetical protein MSPP1_004136 [Malassezia sp. CBS 17886]|nr:hypothetical protein MSPP1_004136 [Malassezia sp. CBS 17886]